MVDIKITYESLFDILRREKSQDELQELKKDFFLDVGSYIADKLRLLAGEIPPKERETIRIQVKNIKKILKELYERREKKVILMALDSSRVSTSVVPLGALLDKERELYEQILQLFKLYKMGRLMPLLNMDEHSAEEFASPTPSAQTRAVSEPIQEESEPENEPESQDKPEIEDHLQDESEVEDEDPEEPEEQVTEDSEEQSKQKNDLGVDAKEVEILTDLPRFAGFAGAVYGPYVKGDKVQLPEKIAAILAKKGRAKMV